LEYQSLHDGLIDATVVFNRVLSTDEIDQIRQGIFGAAGGKRLIDGFDSGMLDSVMLS